MSDYAANRANELARKILPIGKRMPTSIIELRNRIADAITGEIAEQCRLREEVAELKRKLRMKLEPNDER